MKCAICNGEMATITNGYCFRSKIIGDVFIPNVEYQECLPCGEKLFTPESSAFILDYVKQKEREAIGQLPADDFITASEAIAILGITKQAFSKNPKIKRGFVYCIIKGNRKWYHKKSVELFGENKDGRFSIPQKATSTRYNIESSIVDIVNQALFIATGSTAQSQKKSVYRREERSGYGATYER